MSRVTARQLARRRRMVALVRHGDKLIVETEREAELGRVWHKAHDSHVRRLMEPLTSAEIERRASTRLGPAWRREGDSLVGELERQDFAAGARAGQRDRSTR